ncbi:hypothetical protein ACODYM_29130 [Burkholderia gladioli]|uniref:hypothetical protein n=1 Tax=Burkholderia gladioli TaxID=28095 RepID=UPI003B50CF05
MRRFVINLFLVASVIVGMVVTGNALAILGLLMLLEMEDHPPKRVLAAQLAFNQQQLEAASATADLDHRRQPIGFTAEVG